MGMLTDNDTGQIKWTAIVNTILSGLVLAAIISMLQMSNKLERIEAIQQLQSKLLEEIRFKDTAQVSNSFSKSDAAILKKEVDGYIQQLREDLNNRITREVIRSNELALPRYRR